MVSLVSSWACFLVGSLVGFLVGFLGVFWVVCICTGLWVVRWVSVFGSSIEVSMSFWYWVKG